MDSGHANSCPLHRVTVAWTMCQALGAEGSQKASLRRWGGGSRGRAQGTLPDLALRRVWHGREVGGSWRTPRGARAPSSPVHPVSRVYSPAHPFCSRVNRGPATVRRRVTGRPVACWLRGRGSRSGPGWSWCLGTRGDRCGQVVMGEAGERVRHREALQVEAHGEALCPPGHAGFPLARWGYRWRGRGGLSHRCREPRGTATHTSPHGSAHFQVEPRLRPIPRGWHRPPCPVSLAHRTHPTR